MGRVVLYHAVNHVEDDFIDFIDQEVIPAVVVRHYGEGRVKLASLVGEGLFTASHGAGAEGLPLESCWCYPPMTRATIEVPIRPPTADHQGSVLNVGDYARPVAQRQG